MLSQAHLRNSNPSLDGPAFGAVTSGFLLGWPVLAAIGLGSLALLLGALTKAELLSLPQTNETLQIPPKAA
jgi:hypothetical protein